MHALKSTSMKCLDPGRTLILSQVQKHLSHKYVHRKIAASGSFTKQLSQIEFPYQHPSLHSLLVMSSTLYRGTKLHSIIHHMLGCAPQRLIMHTQYSSCILPAHSLLSSYILYTTQWHYTSCTSDVLNTRHYQLQPQLQLCGSNHLYCFTCTNQKLSAS